MMKTVSTENETKNPATAVAGNLPDGPAVFVYETDTLYDECGDTLWDPVLAQENLKCLTDAALRTPEAPNTGELQARD